MPSPDVAAYTGLTLVDVTAQDLVNEAIARLQTAFPDWVARESHTETVLLEAKAAIAEDIVYAINRLPDGMTEVLLRLFDMTRDTGAPPQADVRFNLSDTLGHTIPAGTTVRLDLGDNAEPVDLATLTDLVVAPGSNYGVVTAAGDTAGIAGNGVAAGTVVEVLDAIGFVNNAVLATASGGGRLPEDGATFLDRARPRLSRLTSTLVRPADVAAYVAENPAVHRVKVLDLFDTTLGTGAPGSHPGHLAVAVATTGGGSIGSTARANLAAELRSRMHAGLAVTVVDADVTTVDVAVTVQRYYGYTDAAVQAAVQAIVADYLDPDTWAWGTLVRVNEIIAAADRAEGVDTVIAVTTPAADQTLTGFAPLAKAGTITVTVQAPT